jgi:hypothetical protein
MFLWWGCNQCWSIIQMGVLKPLVPIPGIETHNLNLSLL